MINRIKENEERLDNILLTINELNNVLDKFKDKYDDIVLLNKYYGSDDWFKDKVAYEKNNISNIKAGVLSEDAIWNMNEDVKEIIIALEEIINIYKNKSL